MKLKPGDKVKIHFWFKCRKCVITVSRAHTKHEKTNMKKLSKGIGVYANLWKLKQEIAELIFVNPNIPSLKYERDMDPETINSFTGVMKKEIININMKKFCS